ACEAAWPPPTITKWLLIGVYIPSARGKFQEEADGMASAIRFESFGGPEVLQYVEATVPEPGTGQARVVHSAIGVNFIDVYHRTGLYPLALPSGIGGEAAGVVAAVGPGVTHVRAGDRVAYTAHAPLGAYSTERVLDARWLVRLPPKIREET